MKRTKRLGRMIGSIFLLTSTVFGSDLRFNLPPRDFPAGGSPIALVAADFNGDGIEDLAVSSAGAINILIGVGNGVFRKPVAYTVGGTQQWNVVTADFNGDGHLDLAVGVSTKLVVLLGKGDGTFQPAPTQPSLTRADFVVTADFNRDGKADLATTDPAGGVVHLLLGNGDGTFVNAGTTAAGTQPLGLAVADFNGDRAADLVVAGNAAVMVLLGSGHGTFASAGSYSINQLQGPLSVGDLNGDGVPDIVATGDGGLAILLGTGGGKFAPPSSIGIGADVYGVAIRDLNGDGVMDMAVPYQSTNQSVVQIYLGKGDGTFNLGESIAVGQDPSWVIATHVNGDKALDLVTANLLGNSVSVLLGHGDGTFGRQPVSLGTGARGASGIAAGDVNGDGILDLVTANASTNNISVLLGEGHGKFASGQVFPAGGEPKSVALADFNRDGKLDVVTANFSSGTISVLLGNGDGTFQPAQSYSAGIQTQSVAAGDMNNDGIPDIVVASVQSETVLTFLSNGDGTFQAPITYFINNGFAGMTQIALADLNGDGKLDVVGEYAFGSGLQVLANHGDGSLYEIACICGPPYPNGTAIADFNKDGLPDVAFGAANLVQVSLNAGGGSFASPVGTSVVVDPTLLGAGDFDGDGYPDTVSTGLNTNTLNFATGNGDGTFGTGPVYPAGSPAAVAIADFNGDGKLDVAVAELTGVEILLNTTP